MAQYDVYRGKPGLGYLLDCQSELLDHLPTRVVIPLIPAELVSDMKRLNPILTVQGEPMTVATHLIFTIGTKELDKPVASLSDDHYTIKNALDMLISGY